MQFPVQNAAPFEFARPLLLLAALPFVVGFGGYLLFAQPNVAVAQTLQQPAVHAPVAVVSTPIAHGRSTPRKI